VAALEKMGKAYREATQILEDYYDVFYKETRLAAEGQLFAPEEECAAMLEKNWLIDRVAQPLSEWHCHAPSQHPVMFTSSCQLLNTVHCSSGLVAHDFLHTS
jgi:hypothetical protein